MQLASKIGWISVLKSTWWLAGGGKALTCSGVKAPRIPWVTAKKAATKNSSLGRNTTKSYPIQTKKHPLFII
jgi:hypothetical protein